MAKLWRRVGGWGALALGVLASTGAAPVADSGAAVTFEQLTRLSWPELEQLYRQAEPGPPPTGYARGRAVFCADKRLSGLRSALTRAMWHGKLFDCAGESLVNQWCGFRAIRAEVYCGPSWLDGRPSIIMNYCRTSKVWADVRDEVREVAPGLYLGLMYKRKPCGPAFQMYFVLEACGR